MMINILFEELKMCIILLTRFVSVCNLWPGQCRVKVEFCVFKTGKYSNQLISWKSLRLVIYFISTKYTVKMIICLFVLSKLFAKKLL